MSRIRENAHLSTRGKRYWRNAEKDPTNVMRTRKKRERERRMETWRGQNTGRNVALTRKRNRVTAGRGCRVELEIGYERVTTRRALEVLTFADVFKLPEQEIFLPHTHAPS